MKTTRSPIEAVERSLRVVEERDYEVMAWVHLDPDLARTSARQAPDGTLNGLTVGVKDIFDTFDQPTEYGTPIYLGHRPRADAAVVARMRAAGAVVLGKTVTTELAWVTAGPTRNPHRMDHTPGGSSSGSAAAVAAGMVDIALGTQTAGSVVRPASFCGVWGLKPTFGLLPTSGVKQEAPSLDTVGLFAADPEVLQTAFEALTALTFPPGAAAIKVAMMRTDLWDRADPDCMSVVAAAAELLGASERDMPAEFLGLAGQSSTIHLFEGARSYDWEQQAHSDLLSPLLREILGRGWDIDLSSYASAVERMKRARTKNAMDELFGGSDVLVTASAVGEAPAGLSSTGDPAFNRLWTVLGCPALNVPGFFGGSGLPIGVQLVARPFGEGLLLRAGTALFGAIPDRRGKSFS